MKSKDQEKARLLISDYIGALGYGGVTAFLAELSAFNGSEPFSRRTLDKWLKDESNDLQAQNFLIVFNFINSEKFQSIVKWSADEDDNDEMQLQKNALLEDKKEIRKSLSIATSRIFSQTDYENSIFKLLDGYWASEPIITNRHYYFPICVGIKILPEQQIGKIVILDFQSNLHKIETGVFILGDIVIAERERVLHGQSWSKHSPEKHHNFDLIFLENEITTDRGVEFLPRIELHHESITCVDSNYLTGNDFIFAGKPEIKALLDLHLNKVLPHYE